jgi:hypothetical protein
MEITSRQTAITQRLHKYFTGQPCKNGHIAERYTQSSGCSECIHPKFPERKMRREALRRLTVCQGFIVHDEDLSTFRAALLFYMQLREPSATESDLLSGQRTSGPTHRVFRLFADDIPAMLEMEAAMRSRRSAQ